jgi:HAD superfamily hydrolase (TIGR01509 family)
VPPGGTPSPAPGLHLLPGMSAILFDIDGTLIDSVDLHAKAWQDVFAKYGKRVSFEQVRRQIGKGSDQLLPVFFSAEELQRFGKQMDQERAEQFRSEYLPRVRPFPRVRELFERLRRDGVKVALASSSKKEDLAAYKKIAGIEDLVQAETSSDDADRSKPHPDIFEAALVSVGKSTPAHVLAVGDTPYDAEAAGKLGLRAVGVLCGGWEERELRDAGCVAIFRDPADLLANYEKLKALI